MHLTLELNGAHGVRLDGIVRRQPTLRRSKIAAGELGESGGCGSTGKGSSDPACHRKNLLIEISEWSLRAA